MSSASGHLVRTSEKHNTNSDNQLLFQNGDPRKTSVVAKDPLESLGCEILSGACSLYCPDNLV